MKQTEVGLIPEDWEVKYFKELIVECIGGGTPSRGVKDYWNGDIPWMTVKDFASFNKNSTQEYITYEGLKNSATRIVKAGELIIATRIALGKIVCYDVDVTINQDLKTIKLNAEVDKSFFQFYYKSIENKIIEKGSGSTVLGLSIHDLKSFQIPLPPLAEQEAIANALSDADAWIEKLEQLIAKKRHIKQGAMQTLLTPPSLSTRSGIGTSDAEPVEAWEVKKLGEMSIIHTGKKNNQDKIENGKYPFFVRSQTVERINSYSYNGEAILIPGEGNLGSIVHYINGKFDFHQRVYKISDFELLNGKFLYYYFSMYFGNHAMQNTVKATVDSIRLQTLQEFEIAFPSLSEQERIATILSDVDAEIAVLEQQLGKARYIKQGMMQELLTGRVRLV